MIPKAAEVRLTPEDRAVLEARIRAPPTEQRDVFRARIILLTDEERSTRSIARMLGTMPRTVSTWRGRYAREGLAGLYNKASKAAVSANCDSGTRAAAHTIAVDRCRPFDRSHKSPEQRRVCASQTRFASSEVPDEGRPHSPSVRPRWPPFVAEEIRCMPLSSLEWRSLRHSAALLRVLASGHGQLGRGLINAQMSGFGG
jgi:Winged helix-turn helix